MCLRSKLVHKFVSPPPPPPPPLLRPPPLLLRRKSRSHWDRSQVRMCIIQRRLLHALLYLWALLPPATLTPPLPRHLPPSLSLPSGSVAPDFLPVWKCERSSLSLRIKPRPRETKRKEYIKYFRMASSSPLRPLLPPQVEVRVRLALASATMPRWKRARATKFQDALIIHGGH